MNGRFERLKRLFYEGEALIVTRDLLGRYIVKEPAEGKIIGKIVEVEAYTEPYDKGSLIIPLEINI